MSSWRTKASVQYSAISYLLRCETPKLDISKFLITDQNDLAKFVIYEFWILFHELIWITAPRIFQKEFLILNEISILYYRNMLQNSINHYNKHNNIENNFFFNYYIIVF